MREDLTGIEAELRSYGISVESVDEREDALGLTYMTAFPGESVAHREMGRALNALIDAAAADDWEPVQVDATVVRTTDDVQGTWRAEASWFERLLAGDLSETEFSTRVLETLEERETASGGAESTPEGER